MGAITALGVLALVVWLFWYLWNQVEARKEAEQERQNEIAMLIRRSPEMTSDEFFRMRIARAKSGNSRYASEYDFPGVSILHNKTRDVYYVEQGHIVLNQIFKTFAGQGNEAVYFEFECGDNFTIKIVSLEESAHDKLDDLEKYTVKYYDAAQGRDRVHGDRHPPKERPYGWDGCDPDYNYDYNYDYGRKREKYKY